MKNSRPCGRNSRSKILFVQWVKYVEFAIGLDTSGKDLINEVNYAMSKSEMRNVVRVE